jgi:hypothetical protein
MGEINPRSTVSQFWRPARTVGLNRLGKSESLFNLARSFEEIAAFSARQVGCCAGRSANWIA